MDMECGSQIQLSCYLSEIPPVHIEDGPMVIIAVGHDPLHSICSNCLMHRRWLRG